MLLYDNNNGNAKTNKTFDFTGGLTHSKWSHIS